MNKPLLLALGLAFCSTTFAAEWTVGILAMRGEAETRTRWQPLIDELNHAVPGEHFQLRALDLNAMRDAVNAGSVQFVLTNPGQFVQLNSHYHLRWLASLRATAGSEDAATISSTLLVKASSEIYAPQDLRGKTLGAVDPKAFGGYLLGYQALREAGLRPGEDIRLRFTGFPADALLYLLREGVIQAAVVPSCLLETMDKEGLVKRDDYRALMVTRTAPCLTSTPPYPNWSFAAMPEVSDTLADAVARTLLNAGDTSPWRWGAPASTKAVESLLRNVNQYPDRSRLWQDLYGWLEENRVAVTSALLVLLLLAGNYIWVMVLVRRRGKALEAASERLREQEIALEKVRQLNLLGEMASGFAHELNQPLTAIRQYAQGCAIRLQREAPQHALLPVIEQIDQQAARGGDVIRNLRTWAMSPQSHLPRISVSVRDNAQYVWSLLRIPKLYPAARLQSEVPPELRVMLPPALLDQVFANLLLNALQAGASIVWLTASCENGMVCITLQDNAGGMPEERLPLAFQPFRSTKTSGMGLGLAICQRLLRQVSGEILLRNVIAPDGKNGLNVSMRLPDPHKGEFHGDTPC
jgi:two-component system sensor histidine kinase TtrS